MATLINHGGWVFEDVHRSYTVALLAITRSRPWSPASTPESGSSTMSTRATRSHSSPSVDELGNPVARGGGLEDSPHVAIYPGPAVSLEHFRRLIEEKPEEVPVEEFAGWSTTAAFPQVPTRAAFRVWRTMKHHPRFDGADLGKDLSLSLSRFPKRWRARPVQGDLNATNDRWRFRRDDGRGASGRSPNSTQRQTGADS